MAQIYVQNSFIQGVGESVVGQVRKANEDNCGYASTDNGELFVVCDGMGGHVGGATASEIGVKSIIDFVSKNKMEDKCQLLSEALKFANIQIFGRAAEEVSLKGMGTTACIVLIEADDIWMAHVGDSRIYLYSQKDKFLYRVSKDHSFVQGLVDTGQLDDRDAENHPQKNIIMRALGIKEDVKPDVEQEPMHCAKGDIIMICSDGLSGMIDDTQIEKIVCENKGELSALCQQLVDAANTQDKGKDNITCQLIQIEASSVSATKHPDYTPKWRTEGSAVSASTTLKQNEKETALSPSPTNNKRWIWISVLALFILGGGILQLGHYVKKHRHMFKRDYTKDYVQRSDMNGGFDLKTQLREDVMPLAWIVEKEGVSIDENGILTVDSTYVPETATLIKVKADYANKTYEDSIHMHLKYEKVESFKAEQPKTKQQQVPETIPNPTPNPTGTPTPAPVPVRTHMPAPTPNPVPTTPKVEYVLMIRPVVAEDNFSTTEKDLKEIREGKDITISDKECLVYVAKVEENKTTPVSSEMDKGWWRVDGVKRDAIGNKNNAYWYKFSLDDGKDEGVFSFNYKDENSVDKKIKIKLKE